MSIDLALPWLRCPLDREPLHRESMVVRCPTRHAFDLSRQGYLNLLTGSPRHTGDTGEMISDRDRFLVAGHYLPIAEAITSAVGSYAPAGPIVDLAAGTGWYLGHVLDADPERVGIAIDVSTAALRRSARVHPRAAAVGADAWTVLPIVDTGVGAVLSVFGPRTPAEIGRILQPGGVAVVVAAHPDHLTQLRGPIGMLDVEPSSEDRRREAFAAFDLLASGVVRTEMALSRADVRALAGMGPTAFHVDAAELDRRVAAMPEAATAVTAAVVLEVYRRRA